MKNLLLFLLVLLAGFIVFGEDENVGGGALQKNDKTICTDEKKTVTEKLTFGTSHFDRGWEFCLRDFKAVYTKVGLGAGGNDNGQFSFMRDTNGWSSVDIPHDWMIAMPVARNTRNGFRAVGRDYPQNSIGWYRKRFSFVAAPTERPRVWLQFDGIYRNSQVWVNGIYLGHNDSGYIGCRFDVTDLIEYGGKENSIAVRVDASGTEGWWYEGAGIYRHVKLIVKNRDCLAPDSVLFRTLEVGDGKATISASVETLGEGRIEFELDGRRFDRTLTLNNPRLWSPDAPNLYQLIVRMFDRNGKVVDDEKLQVGIRKFEFDPNRGLFINGVSTKLKGVCCHGDMGGVGVAIPDSLHDYRVKLLKQVGVNGNRTCHNPPAPEFLDACDRGGIIVMDETRMFSSSDEGLSQFRRLVLRDRNHPCVAAWSIGNEEHNVQGTDIGRRMAERMKALAKDLAPDIAVTYGGNNGDVWRGVNGVVDVRGVNYIRIGSSKKGSQLFDAMDRYHKEHPNQPIWGTEEASALATRGSFVDLGPKEVQVMKDGDTADNVRFPWVATAEQWWNYAIERDWFCGSFMWTGFDYRGESRWPATVNNFGMMDLCGFPKGAYWYYKANWSDDDVLHLGPGWHPSVTNLVVDSNCDEVEVFVNGRSIGKRKGDRLHHLNFPVVYEPGEAVVRGVRGGRELVSRVATPGKAVKLVASADRISLKADGADATVVNFQAVDAASNEASDCCELVTFECRGAGKIIGVGNGNPISHEDDICRDGKWQRKLFNGKCQVVVKAGDAPGELRIVARLANGEGATEVLTIERGNR